MVSKLCVFLLMLLFAVPARGQDFSSALPVRTPEAVPKVNIESLGTKIQTLKEEILDLNSRLYRLQEDLLFREDASLVIFLRVEGEDYFKLDSVKIRLNDTMVSSHLYSHREVTALLKGGVQRLYTGKIKSGVNELVAVFTGRDPEEKAYEQVETISIEKKEGATFIQIIIRDVADKKQLSVHAEGVVSEGDTARKKSWEILKREAYYHYFIKDYLTAGTRLKSIEASGEDLKDARINNEAKILLGSLYLAWGMEQSAVRLFGELDMETPPGEKRDQLLLKVVKVQYERSRYQDALETYRLMLPGGRPDLITPDRYLEQARYLAALSHYASGSIQDGIKGLKTLPPDSPYFPFAQLTLAKSYYQLNNSAKSLLYLKDLSETDIRRRQHLRTLTEKSRLTWGQVLMEEGYIKGARRVLANIPPKSPFFPDALFGIGWSYFREEKYLEAILVFQDLIQIVPDHDYALEALTVVGHGYKNLGVFQRALDHYTGAPGPFVQRKNGQEGRAARIFKGRAHSLLGQSI
ncbi:MAG: tetratricopeptide repeat protein [Nitrospira sp.]|nr:tetratricopeptide repeat protein [Candidatus Manganitrophaceae bacterium]HIL34849.1 tetratricopeptide repeat protein [Candidatus Manganitrophaceae bacterium]